MKLIPTVSMLALIALVAGTVAPAFAHDHGRRHHHPGYGRGNGHSHDRDYGNGFFDGIYAALLSIYSTMTSGDDAVYESDTLVEGAALFQADGVMTPVFGAFAAAMADEMSVKLGAQMEQVSSEELNAMIAQQILDEAAAKSVR